MEAIVDTLAVIAAERRTLDREVIHIWRYPLVQLQNSERFCDCCSADERMRAQRFALDELRIRYLVGRGLLRLILSGYLDTNPEHLEFVYGAHGKPAVGGNLSDAPLRFSFSGSNNIAVVAITRDRQVGVDIELIRPLDDLDRLVEDTFSASERTLYDRLTADMKLRAFYRVWTRKEAYLKATGEGLSVPLDQFAVWLEPHAEAVRLLAPHDPAVAQRWSLRDFDCGDRYQGAVCAEGKDWSVVCVI